MKNAKHPNKLCPMHFLANNAQSYTKPCGWIVGFDWFEFTFTFLNFNFNFSKQKTMLNVGIVFLLKYWFEIKTCKILI
jgi:hypothetical protein